MNTQKTKSMTEIYDVAYQNTPKYQLSINRSTREVHVFKLIAGSVLMCPRYNFYSYLKFNTEEELNDYLSKYEEARGGIADTKGYNKIK